LKCRNSIDTFLFVLSIQNSVSKNVQELAVSIHNNLFLQVDYDPLGNVIGDSAPDFLLPFGFRCGVVDSATRLVVFVDGRPYDPSVGRWMVPDYRRLVASVESLAVEPQLTNLYRAGSVLWDQPSADATLATGASGICI